MMIGTLGAFLCLWVLPSFLVYFLLSKRFKGLSVEFEQVKSGISQDFEPGSIDVSKAAAVKPAPKLVKTVASKPVAYRSKPVVRSKTVASGFRKQVRSAVSKVKPVTLSRTAPVQPVEIPGFNQSSFFSTVVQFARKMIQVCSDSCPASVKSFFRYPLVSSVLLFTIAMFGFVFFAFQDVLMNPSLSIPLSALFGCVLFFSASILRFVGQDVFLRICQFLVSGSILVFYGICFAASQVYGLIPVWAGLMGMLMVTGISLISALRFGSSVAIFGLMGGFLMPVLLSISGGGVVSLFAYLFLLTAALLVLVRWEPCRDLSLAAVVAAFSWVVIWMFTRFVPSEAPVLGLFVVGVCSLVVSFQPFHQFFKSFKNVVKVEPFSPGLSFVALNTGLVLLAVLAFISDFAWSSWLAFGVLAVGSCAYSYFKGLRFEMIPWVTLSVTAVLLFGWLTVVFGGVEVFLPGLAFVIVSGLLFAFGFGFSRVFMKPEAEGANA